MRSFPFLPPKTVGEVEVNQVTKMKEVVDEVTQVSSRSLTCSGTTHGRKKQHAKIDEEETEFEAVAIAGLLGRCQDNKNRCLGKRKLTTFIHKGKRRIVNDK